MRNTLRSLLLAGLAIQVAPWSSADAQVCCEPAYSVKSQVVMEEQLETRYRVVLEACLRGPRNRFAAPCSADSYGKAAVHNSSACD